MTFSERPIQPDARVPLAPMTTLGIGGCAQWFFRARAPEDVARAHRWCEERRVPLFVVGGGSNLVVADRGIDGLVVHMAIREVHVSVRGDETMIRAGAGEAWDPVVEMAVSRGLAGLECLSGIPGTVGGTPIQNVGAYGQEVSRAIADVTAFDRRSGALAVLTPDECGFGYRTSRFKHSDAGRFVVCGVTLHLRPGPPTIAYPDLVDELQRRAIAAPTLAEVRLAILSIRRRKGMVVDEADRDTRSVGSFFTNPVVSKDTYARLASEPPGTVRGFPQPDGRVKVPAAWLIERAGFRCGYQSGAVGLSSKHPLALVNRGGATARDVLQLAARIKREVTDRFGIWLVPEPVFVGFDGDADVCYLLEKR